MIRDYMTVLNILMQNPEASFEEIVGEVQGSTADLPDKTLDSENREVKRAGAFTAEDIEF